MTGALRSASETSAGRALDLSRAREHGRGREADTPEEICGRVAGYPVARAVVDLRRSHPVHVWWRRLLCASSGTFPAVTAIVSLYGLFADASTIGKHLTLLAGILPGGVLDLISDQIVLLARQPNETLGAAFAVALIVALVSANSGVAALFDALNVVYGEEEKRSLVRFYAITFLFTLGGIAFVTVAISAVVVLPLVLKLVGSATTSESLLSFLRWPILLSTLTVSLGFIYRYGPSRRDARWRWVTWGSITAAVLWIAASMLFSWLVATFDSYDSYMARSVPASAS